MQEPHATIATLPIGNALARKALFSLARIDRIHIIGCSRSGTTMLHLAMMCFQNVVLSEFETGINYPPLRKRAELALRYGWRPGRKHYVTKRLATWHHARQANELIERVRSEKIGLIQLVRDPRDVMLSRYPGSPEPYVSGQHWYDSISAADRIFHELGSYPRKLTVRYEDLVLNSAHAGRTIESVFGLRQNPGAFPISQVKDNFEHLRVRFASFALRNLSGLRNMDANSIGKWRRESNAPGIDTFAPHIHDRLMAFCAEHGY